MKRSYEESLRTIFENQFQSVFHKPTDIRNTVVFCRSPAILIHDLAGIKANLVPRARDPVGRGTKGSGIIHLFSPQILEIRDYCACAKFFKMEDMRTEMHTIF